MSSDAMQVEEAAPRYRAGGAAQDVPPGYKRTDVGVIPEDWDVSPLGDIVEFLDGQRRPVKSSDRAKMTGIFPYYGASGIVDYVNDFLFDEDLVLLGEDGENILSRNLPLAFRVSGKIWVNNHAHVLRPRPGIDIDYLTEFLESQDYSEYNSGTAQPKLNKQSCTLIPIALPRPSEQRAIAEALSDVDGLLGALEALIAKKRAIKQAVMQQLLTGKTRLPGFSGDWETKQLGEVADIEMGQSPSSAFYNQNGTGLPLIQGNADIANRRTIRRIFTTQITKRARRGDILLSVRAPVGEVSRATFDACLGRGVCAIRFPNDFLFHYLVYLEPSWARHSRGSTFDSANSTDVRAVQVLLPDSNEQIAIATVLSDMDAEIAALEAHRDKTHQIKQGMLQQLLTGRVRLVKPEARPAC